MSASCTTVRMITALGRALVRPAPPISVARGTVPPPLAVDRATRPLRALRGAPRDPTGR